MDEILNIPNIGPISKDSKFHKLNECSDKIHRAGENGVVSIYATGDKKVEFIVYKDSTLAYVTSKMGYPACYPVHPVKIKKPVKAVLMDLDGTSVRSEDFWIWIIELTTASLLDDKNFNLEESDLPYVSGHSVSEHLSYCIKKYCPEKNVEEARKFYFEHTHLQMKEISEGRGRKDAFIPSPGIKEFLLKLKEKNIKIGLVTSGLYEKAWPEILSAFRTLKMGDPIDFYDAIITAGFPIRKNSAGTLGELSPKPHPWLYAEICRVGLGIGFEERNSVVGIEDSGAGVCSIRLAGFAAIGISDGNIVESGTKELCQHYCENFDEILDVIL